jgi:hypothetical protein
MSTRKCNVSANIGSATSEFEHMKEFDDKQFSRRSSAGKHIA